MEGGIVIYIPCSACVREKGGLLNQLGCGVWFGWGERSKKNSSGNDHDELG